MSDPLVFRTAHRELLWTLTSSSWRTRTLPADNLDDPEVYLLAWAGRGGRGQIAGNAGRLRAAEADRARAMSDRLACFTRPGETSRDWRQSLRQETARHDDQAA